MLISLKWLSDYVSLEGVTTDLVAKTLTSLGLEVENIRETKQFDEQIVVGKVISATKHPNADTLRLCTVDVNEGTLLNIVCGAPNARTGIYVAVAKKGAVLPDGMKIKASKIRGEASEGMLCSESELGISKEHSGIIELDASYELGKTLSSYLQVQDTILELSVTPNRSDCLSYIGVARDLAAKLGRPLKLPIAEPAFSKTGGETVHIHIDSENTSSRFCAALLKGVKAVSSPPWLQKRLEAAGMRPLNVLIDVTNYVMLEYGQPIHAYDRRFVAGDTLQVRSAKEGEPFTTLDGAKILLNKEDLLIFDATKAVGLAGIMGGENSEIKEDTTEIIVEAAHFDPQSIRKAARRLGIHSEASHRFERGIDIERIPEVIRRVCSLLSQCLVEQKEKEPVLASPLCDKYLSPLTHKKIALRLARARTIIANPVLSLKKCEQNLEALGFVVLDKTDERILFEIPSWRNDIQREIDLIEEIARLEGYDKIPYEVPRIQTSAMIEDPYIDFYETVKQSLATMGMCEVMTYPFVGEEDCRKLGLSETHGLWPSVRIANALNEKQAFLQTTLMPGLLNALVRNRNFASRGVRLFEVSRAFFNQEALQKNAGSKEWEYFLRPSRKLTHKAKTEQNRVLERELVAGVIDHPFSAKTWDGAESAPSFYHAKALVMALLNQFAISHAEFLPCEADWLPFLHPKAAAWLVVDKVRLGWIGELHPQLANSYDLGADLPVCFELDFEALFSVCHKRNLQIKSPARFPVVSRDLAMLVQKDLSFHDFEVCVRKFPAKKHLSGIKLFDLYEGEHVAPGMKSFAVTCTFQSQQGTLTDEEVDREVLSLLEHLKVKLGAVQR